MVRATVLGLMLLVGCGPHPGVGVGSAGADQGIGDLGQARWIWAPELAGRPRAVILVRDFEVADPPRTASLVLRAADGWIGWINGHRVAAVATPSACVLSRVDLAPFVRTGTNRLAVELRFDGHLGGVLGCVVLDGRCQVPTDTRWELMANAAPEVLQGWSTDAGVPAVELGPADLASSCMSTITVPGLDCSPEPLDLALVPKPDGGVGLDLPLPGRLELLLPLGGEVGLIRVAAADGSFRDDVVLAGAGSFLELSARSLGRVEVSGAPVVGALLWPWNAACGAPPTAVP